ncbi:MAG: rhodanese-like domain-containing protein [Hylemonella sp.]|nr:rhodanese-like domain-containing protein [Hylemonella sp.]
MKKYTDLVADCLAEVKEIMPWDLASRLGQPDAPLLLDIREPAEFDAVHIAGSIHVPRGILESAADWDYDDTVPALAGGREREIVVICRSGNRSVLAAHTLQRMGFRKVASLKTGVRGWNDFEQPLVDRSGQAVDIDAADALLASRVRPEQRRPA